MEIWLPKPIVGDRVRLRAVQGHDVTYLVELWTDDRVRRYLGGPLDPEAALTRATLAVGARNAFAVEQVGGGSLTGLCSIGTYRTGDTEVSYEFLPAYWGAGYALEAVALVVQWAFDNLRPQRLIAVTQSANDRSRRLLHALGMTECDEFEEFDAAQTMYAINHPSGARNRCDRPKTWST
jgi:RimJ/RimL family protein N-acetyltransferase